MPGLEFILSDVSKGAQLTELQMQRFPDFQLYLGLCANNFYVLTNSAKSIDMFMFSW